MDSNPSEGIEDEVGVKKKSELTHSFKNILHL
jgi:hypothetical protein